LRTLIISSSDYPYHGAAENFVRMMTLGLFNTNEVSIEIVRFWGNRFNNVNDTSIKCNNFLFKKPFENEFLKIFEHIFQILYIPFFVIYRKIYFKDNYFIFYGIDRSSVLVPFLFTSKLLNIKCVRVITEIYPISVTLKYWWRFINIIFEKIQLKLVDKYFDGIIVLSNFLYDLSIKNGVNSSKLLFIPHFIELLNSNFLNDNSKQKFTIGYCGSISLDNGIDDLLESFYYISNLYPNEFNLLIIGSFPASLKYLEPNHPNIKVTGYLTKEKVFSLLNKCSVLVNPRKYSILSESGFPTKLGEYFATGLPVITTNVGVINYFFENESCLFKVDSDSPVLLGQKIIDVFNNYKLAKKVGFNGYKWAENNLDYNLNARKLLNFLKII
jgi:glycosyltransferase involved in cell wall biosynthesis